VSSLIKGVLSRFLERIKSHPLFASLYYATRAAEIVRERLFTRYPVKYQVDKAPLRKDFADYEVLFTESEHNFEAIISPYASEFSWFLGRIYNGAFESIDAELYYAMIRKYRPHLVIEVGSGHSTHFAMDALKRNGSGRMVSIDPKPRIGLPEGVEHTEARVEDIDADVFKNLNENDILFIDSSHLGQEALYHCGQIMPNLGAGVIIHHHDFTYPYSIYYGDDPVRWGEPDVLLRFFMDNRESFEVIVCASYVRFKNAELVNRFIKSYRWNPRRIPGSLWTRKKPRDPLAEDESKLLLP
jgi:hypothetical protein